MFYTRPKRRKRQSWWYIKQDLHREQRCLRQNRRRTIRFHLTYEYLSFWCKPLVYNHRPYQGRWKQFEGWDNPKNREWS